MAVRPIFIFSIVRSGSTLVQRILAAHDGVATVSEPWLLLPYAYTTRRAGVDAEYNHQVMVRAIDDFCEVLPNGREDYRSEVRACVLSLYEKAMTGDARYFVDKTPTYCFVAEEIMNLFPEGKFVFLWRNPLSVVSSIVETWPPWHPTLFREELFTGLPRLVAAYATNRERAHAVRYEDLLDGDEHHWRSLTAYLGIEFDPAALGRFSETKLNGSMGDPTGPQRYSALSSEPGQKWKQTLANPLRRAWCRRYLRFLGDERLAMMGYDRRRMVAQLDAQPTSIDSLAPDLLRLVKDVVKEPVRVRTRKRKIGGPNVIRELLNG
jgi:hypothetical protein